MLSHVKIYRHLPLTILHVCIKDESCMLKTPSYRIRTKVLTKFSCDLDLLTPKCISMFLLPPSCSYVWNMIAVPWKLTKLSCQNQSVDKVQLWLLTPKCIGIFLSLSCALKITQVIVLEPKCWQSSGVTLTFWPQNVQVSSSHHPASMYEIWKL